MPLASDEPQLNLSDFKEDRPWPDSQTALDLYTVADQIHEVELRRLVPHADARGDLTVLFSSHYVAIDPPPHVYMVTAAPGSVRAWVYHRRQYDRLAFPKGRFEVVLYDLRPASPTFKTLNMLQLGAANPTQLTIPPFVVHGVRNSGEAHEMFINMPTQAYDPARPDKSRISPDDPRMPFQFD